MGASPPPLTAAEAAGWIERWELQQERYAVERARRTAALLDLGEHAVGGGSGVLVVELGCGPGRLAAAFADRLPAAEIVAIDADPLLLEIGRAAHPGPVRFVEATVGAPGWLRWLDRGRRIDLVVTSTTLHYLDDTRLAATYGELASHLRTGGLLLNADHLLPEAAGLATLAQVLGEAQRARVIATGSEDWRGWWAAARADPVLGPRLRAHGSRGPTATGDHRLPSERHVTLLRDAGFAEAGIVWRDGPSAVLAALR